MTANCVMYCTDNPSCVQRRDGDKTEILFDIMTIDKKKRKIYITRVEQGKTGFWIINNRKTELKFALTRFGAAEGT